MSTSLPILLGRVCLFAGLIFLLFAPSLLVPGKLVLLTQALTMFCLAMLWNLVAGYGNIVVIGQHAFVGIGSYAFFGFAILMDWNLYASFAGVMAVSAIFGAVFYGLIYKLRTAYLAVGSWVVAETLMLIASRLGPFGGGSGLSLPTSYLREFGRRAPERIGAIYLWVLVLTLVIFFGIWLIMRSRIGLALSAMRDSEEGAAIAGVNTTLVRATTFIVAAPFIGLAGVMVTLQKARISHISSFSMLDWTIYVLFIVVIGGLGSLEGPIIGTIIFFVLREALQNFGVWYLITLGVLAIFIILYEPKGLWGLLRRKLSGDLLPITHKNPMLKNNKTGK